jgi:RNA polymerase sigma factor (sigma-70 family)
MASGRDSVVLRQAHCLFDAGTVAGLAEGELLERFASRRDEAAFEAIVVRHGPMVLGVCRRLLADPHDVEDAFQSTFLVLVRRARALRGQEVLGPWLHGVAYRVAARARAVAARRRVREVPGAEELAVGPGRDMDLFDLRSVLDEEVNRLPEKFRLPVVLCHLEGRTLDEAARQLRWTVGMVRGRLSRGRERLRGRLARRGLGPSAATLGALFSAEATAAGPSRALVDSTIRAAVATAAGRTAAGLVSAATLALTERTIRIMFLTKLRTAAGLVLAAGLIATGVVALARQIPARPPRDPQVERPRPEARPRAEKDERATPRPANPATHLPFPYVVEPPDLIQVEVLKALRDRPITGERLVRPDGTIHLGFYGEVDVAGLTLDEVKEKVVLHLRRSLGDEMLGLRVPDGQDPEKFVEVAPADTDRVYVDVVAYNSKVYYIEGEVQSPGRLPVTGNETVLDAIHYAGGLTEFADRDKVRVIRREHDTPKILPVNYAEITGGTDSSTNYHLLPGDRLFIPRDPNAKPSPTAGARGMTDSTQFHALERRMDQLERKLDQMLELLEQSRPATDPERGPGAPR